MEERLRLYVQAHFPDASFLGEETGALSHAAWQTTFAPLLYGVALAILLTLLLKETGPAVELADVGDFEADQGFAISMWLSLGKRAQTGAVVARNVFRQEFGSKISLSRVVPSVHSSRGASSIFR